MIELLLFAATPVPRTTSLCPIGYNPVGSYCTPAANTRRRALPRTETLCPPGFYPSLEYCVERR